MATGVRQRHGRECNRNGRCKCPYEAFVYSKRDRKKIRKTFPTHAAAQAWRDDAKTAVRKRTLRAPASTTVDQAAEAWLEGARKGLIRNRKGDPYKPATIRAYEIALRLRVLPEIGSMRLSEVTRTDLQDLVDGLLAVGPERERDRRDAAPAPCDLQAGAGTARDGDRGEPDQRPADAGGDAVAVIGSPRQTSAPICSRHSGGRTGRCGRPRCTQGCAAAS